ncbi:uncharacterized protein LOC134837267 [Culicoides brevitarsis]|uniref:uncharacterized protein LOC134837267 n=1 Tax=Culicoides brevitarsis TaxID=469753 RepID=UPI00307C60A2
MFSKKEEELRKKRPWRPWKPKVAPRVTLIDLPMELLIIIYKYLNTADIDALSLSCKRLLEASKYYEFMERKVLNLHKVDFEEHGQPIAMLTNSFRYFAHVSLYLVRFADNNLFWRIFGKFIKTLSFRMCVIKKVKFLQILCLLPNLESLTIYNFDELLSTWDLEKKEKIKPYLPKVKTLKLQKINFFSPQTFDFLTDMMPYIEHIEISDCFVNCPSRDRVRIIDHIFYFIAMQPLVHTLSISGTHVDDIALGKLGSIVGLKLDTFSMTFMGKISDDGILTLINALENLTNLDLSGSLGLVDDAMSIICRRIPNLKVFKMRKCVMVTCEGMKELIRLRKLELLDISECERVKDEGFVEGVCPPKWKDWKENLKELHMASLSTLSEYPVIKVAEHFFNLTVLDLNASSNCVSDFTMQLINRYLVKLHVLNLDGCGRITDAGVTGFGFVNEYGDRYSHSRSKFLRTSKKANYSIQRLNQLRTLKLAGCYHISDKSISEFRFNELRELVIGRCPQITINGIRMLIDQCPGLETLDLESGKNITDKCVELISLKLKRLKTLKLICCTQLTNDSMHCIALNCKVLKNLYIRGCMNIKNAESILYGLSSLKNIYSN